MFVSAKYGVLDKNGNGMTGHQVKGGEGMPSNAHIFNSKNYNDNWRSRINEKPIVVSRVDWKDKDYD